MHNSMLNFEPGKTRLFHPRWRNTPDVYLPPEVRSQASQVPTLIWFCLQCISEFPDQIQLPFKLIYRSPNSPPPKSFRLIDRFLRDGIATSTTDAPNADISHIDPRLWVTIIQIFDHIPPGLRTYTLSLNDDLLPLLQALKNTETFSLITILELPGCDALTDDSIAELKCLHTLAAFDASGTSITAYGILTLSRTLLTNNIREPSPRLSGPWGLRILRLKHCTQIDDGVYRTLSCFPLLSVVDLRGTKCSPPALSDNIPFSPSSERILFSSNLVHSLEALQKYSQPSHMFSAPQQYQFTVRVQSLCHPRVAESLSRKLSTAPQLLHFRYEVNLTTGSHRRLTVRLKSGYSRKGNDGVNDDIEVIDHDDCSGKWDQDYTRMDTPCEGELNDTKSMAAGSSTPLVNGDTEGQRPAKRSRSISLDGHSGGDHLEIRDRLSLRGLHWYSADRQRANTYVPLSRPKSGYEDKLMLYRSVQPWNILEQKLQRLSEKDSQRESSYKCTATPLVSASAIPKNRLKAQAGLQSMTALALRRRQAETPQLRFMSQSIAPKNPFAKTQSSSQPSRREKTGPYKSDLNIQRDLKPISSLKVPAFTENIIKQGASIAQPAEIGGEANPVASTIQKDENSTATTTWGPLELFSEVTSATTSSLTDQGEEQSKRREKRPSDPQLITSTGSSSLSTATKPKHTQSQRLKKPQKSRGEKVKDGMGEAFDWKAWASKKQT